MFKDKISYYFVGEKNLINLLLFKIAFKQKSQEVL